MLGYEYKELRIGQGYDRNGREAYAAQMALLNDLGAQGWEAVGMSPVVDNNGYFVLLKRPVVDWRDAPRPDLAHRQG